MTESEYKILFNKLYSPLCNYASKIIKNIDEAEDIVQGIFVEFWNKENRDELAPKAEQYIVRSIKFKCIDYQRKEKVKRKHQEEAIQYTNQFDEEEVIAFDSDEIKMAIQLAIEQLPPKTKEVFVQSKINGKRYKEIAEEMNISTKTVENQMGRAFKYLREHLTKYKELLFIPILIIFK